MGLQNRTNVIFFTKIGEAVVEACPQLALQAFVLVKSGEGTPVLYASLATSLISVSMALSDGMYSTQNPTKMH